MANVSPKIGEEKGVLGVLAPGAERCTRGKRPKNPSRQGSGGKDTELKTLGAHLQRGPHNIVKCTSSS